MSSRLPVLAWIGWFVVLAMTSTPGVAQGPLVTALDIRDGQVVLGWVSSSSFYYCRAWGEEKCPPRAVGFNESIKVVKTDAPANLRLSTEYVTVEVDKQDGRLRVVDSKDKELMTETAPVARDGQVVSVERVAATDEAFFGLGARTDARADARGQIIGSTKPFLISSRGYGLYHESPGNYVFDLASSGPDRYRIALRPSRRLEYYFYYGPDPKSILEEHRLVILPRGVQDFSVASRASLPRFTTPLPAPAVGSWASLADSMYALVHASLSAIVSPVFDLAPYRDAPDLLFRRAVQLASVMPLVCDASARPIAQDKRKIQEDLLRWRRRLVPFLQTYADEIGDRGYPMIHPLAMQYPSDVKGGKIADEFLLGDEILVAPMHTEGNRRAVYFPMGNWTDLRTNKIYSGRQQTDVETPLDELPLFVRNGSIIPLASDEAGGPMALHYLPRLAAEFFLYEPDISEYSQMHASPALDLVRLEIESHKARNYEWIVHHMPVPREIRTGGTVFGEVKERGMLTPGHWHYDPERQNIHIVVEVPADATRVTRIAF